MPSYPAKNILCFPIFLPRKRRLKVSYVFKPNVEIDDIPAGGRFPFRTVMHFDYGFLRGDDCSLQQQFDDLEVKCHLDREEYLNLVYAMYCGKRTPTEHKPYLKKVLEEAYGSN